MIQSTLPASNIPIIKKSGPRLFSHSLQTESHRSSARFAVEAGGATILCDALAIPQFLLNRIGCPWTQVQTDLRSATRSDPEYFQMLHELTAFVETNVAGSANQPRHGSGILIGLPLTASLRRRLFVCPESNHLLRISPETINKTTWSRCAESSRGTM